MSDARWSYGIHKDLPFDAYLSGNGLPAYPISGSDVVAFENECPAHSFAFWRGNPERIAGDGGSASMRLGSAAHAYILEGFDAFEARYAVKPDGLSLATREGKAWKETVGEREIVSHDDHRRIIGMAGELRRNPDTRPILAAGGQPEVTMIAKCPETGLNLIARPDLWVSQASLIINLKTTANPNPEAWRRTAANLRYDLSDAMARYVARLCGIETPRHGFLVVGSNEPHLCYLAALSAEAAAAADQQLLIILRRFADCIGRNEWPGYATGVVEIGLPTYAANRIASRIQESFAP